MNNKKNKEGAVSIFIVVFSILLLLIIAVSFTLIMFKERRRATETDLSQSAYDSALAGVEDAKRGLLKYLQQTCKNDSTKCGEILKHLDGKDCDAVKFLLKGKVEDSNRSETVIKSTTGSTGKKIDQAYTCVTVKYNTKDYKRDLNDGESAIIPIKTREDTTNVTISWFTKEDLGSKTNFKTLHPTQPFPKKIDSGNPPVLVAQYFKYAKNITDYDLENNTIGPKYQGNTYKNNEFLKTLYLRPTTTDNSIGFGSDTRNENPLNPSGKAAPIRNIKCEKPSDKGYYCRGKINLPEPVAANQWGYFLRIMPLYQKTGIKVEFSGSKGNSMLLGVQPEIDSNGRANNVYRRVNARVELMDDRFVVPGNALKISNGGACKSFSTTHEIINDPDGCL